MEDYIDSEGNVIILKSIRPIVDYPETFLGTKRGAKRQYRYGNLHVREYDDYYTAHEDAIDPRKDPLGHLMVDAPEYLVGLSNAFSLGRHIASGLQKRWSGNQMVDTKSGNGTLLGVIGGLMISIASKIAVDLMVNSRKNIAR